MQSPILKVKSSDIPALGFGTWPMKGKECADAVRTAIETGYRHIDTAQFYANEASVSEGIAAAGVARKDLFITTKLWRDSFVSDDAIGAVRESLQRLKTDYLDLLLIHWPFPEVSVKKMVKDLMEVQNAGLTKLIGVSNFTVAQVKEAMAESGGTIVCNQVEYHPYLSQGPVLKCVRENGLFLTSYSPTARGYVKDDPAIKKIAAKYDKTPVQVTLRWQIQQERVIAIPKAATSAHIKSNFDIFDFTLTDEDMRAIHALARPDGRMIDPDFAPKWDKAA